MKRLGTAVGLAAFRQDLVYLQASLQADEREAVTALAVPIGVLLKALSAERDHFERAENVALAVGARRARRASALGRLVVMFGGVVRATRPDLYKHFFAEFNPSKLARTPRERRFAEVDRLLTEVAALPAEHDLRRTFEAPIRAALVAVRDAAQQAADVDAALAVARTQVEQFKQRADRLRVETHGKLQAFLGDRRLADEFFRPTTTAAKGAPGDDESAPPA